jgi:(1->4)-alpha-D-glucan 1-alpha-D-glucosylmutase
MLHSDSPGEGNSESRIREEARKVVAARRVPLATYRLQLNSNMTFKRVASLVPYLDDLGITDLYLSPILAARPGSPHGYDVCDHNRINPDLGGDEDLAELRRELSRRRMGVLLDIVPNHMGINHQDNELWFDVLENGPSSINARYFDIDWDPAKPELKDKVLLPVLEDQYGKTLESGQFRLVFDSGAFFVYYRGLKLPIAPRTSSVVLGDALDLISPGAALPDEHLFEFRSILTALSYLPPRTEQSQLRIEERNREKQVIKRRTAALYASSPLIRQAIDDTVRNYNGVPGDPRSFDKLDALLELQVYQPAFWRVAGEEINYRRFFDINDLAAIRMELPEVFDSTHELLFRLLIDGPVTGLRVDHADGLRNPAEYLFKLQFRYLTSVVSTRLDARPAAVEPGVRSWLAGQLQSPEACSWPLYVVVEKILSPGETLPRDWPVCGTTGYDFLNECGRVFVDGAGRQALSRTYANFIGTEPDFAKLCTSSKKMTMLVSLGSEINALSHQLERIAEKNRRYRDFTLNTLTFALREVIAALSVYRTYITAPDSISERDRDAVEKAVAQAKRSNPRTAEEVFDFVRDIILLRQLSDFRESVRPDLVNWVLKLQQITGPVMAKGVEDTGFYSFNRLVSLNEVGGDPNVFGIPVSEFHRLNSERAARWPHTLLASSTHDTKRSEDVRARIGVISELPGEWSEAVSRWSQLNVSHRLVVDGDPAPDRNDEYLLYQTLVGSWPVNPQDRQQSRTVCPVFRERILAYMKKAIKEAKVHTSWVNPNTRYEEALRSFILKILDESVSRDFLRDCIRFSRRVAHFGYFNSLSQLVLKLSSPGVPDIYQGGESWDLRLVDPDNRTPVDYESLASALNGLKEEISAGNESGLLDTARRLLCGIPDGRIKMYVTERVLALRRRKADVFQHGEYIPAHAKGTRSGHVCAFVRRMEGHQLVIAVPRLVAELTQGEECAPLGDIWEDTALAIPGGGSASHLYRNIFTGEMVCATPDAGEAKLSASDLFRNFPVAVLQNIKAPAAEP